ncbi:MAG: ubiquitin family protein [Planctomycetota bacterium]|jgi:hypothetical protein
MRTGLLVILLALPAVADPELTSVDHQAMQLLTKTKETPKIVFHFEPSLPAAQVKQAVQRNLGFHRSLEKTMRLQYDGRIHVSLYADMAINKGSVSLCVERGAIEVREVTLLDLR